MQSRPRKKSRKNVLKNKKFRSTSEATVAEHLLVLGVPILYETDRVKYPIIKARTYTPDFMLPNGVFIEVKGWFRPQDRTKHLAIKEAVPTLDVRFVFDNPDTKLMSKSKNGKTYAKWCEQHGFLYCKLSDGIPKEWLE